MPRGDRPHRSPRPRSCAPQTHRSSPPAPAHRPHPREPACPEAQSPPATQRTALTLCSSRRHRNSSAPPALPENDLTLPQIVISIGHQPLAVEPSCQYLQHIWAIVCATYSYQTSQLLSSFLRHRGAWNFQRYMHYSKSKEVILSSGACAITYDVSIEVTISGSRTQAIDSRHDELLPTTHQDLLQ